MYTISKKRTRVILFTLAGLVAIIIILCVKLATSATTYTITRELQGDKYYITIDTKGTPEVEDDEVKSVKKYYNHIF